MPRVGAIMPRLSQASGEISRSGVSSSVACESFTRLCYYIVTHRFVRQIIRQDYCLIASFRLTAAARNVNHVRDENPAARKICLNFSLSLLSMNNGRARHDYKAGQFFSLGAKVSGRRWQMIARFSCALERNSPSFVRQGRLHRSGPRKPR